MSLSVGIAIVAFVAIALCVFELTAGVRLAARTERRRPSAMADKLLDRRLATPEAMQLANGGYLAMFEVDAADAGLFTDPDLAEVDRSIARALGYISERFIVHLRERHVQAREYERPISYPHPVVEWLDGLRARYFLSGKTHRTKRILSLAWVPPSAAASRWSKIAERSVEGDVEADPLAIFEEEVEKAVNFLRSYCRVRRLGARHDIVGGIPCERNEILEARAWEISGRERAVSAPRSLIACNSLLSEPMRGGADVRVGDLEVAIVVVKNFPRELEPLALARLRQLTFDYDFVTRWLPLSSSESQKLMKDAFAEWTTKGSENGRMRDPHALDMTMDAETAIGLERRGTRFGLLSSFVVLRAPTREGVDALARGAQKVLDELGFASFVATRTAEDDFFATFSGDGYHGVRRYQMHQENLAHLFTLHEQSAGPRALGIPSLPPDSPALAYVVAGVGQENVLRRLSLSTEPPDLLNYLCAGKPGSGKSVSLAVLALHFFGRVPYAGVTTVDTGRSLYRLCRFLDAPYYDFLNPERPSVGFALFSDLDDPLAVRDLEDILGGMVELQGVAMTPARSTAIKTALQDIREAVEPGLRNLSQFISMVQDPEGVLRPALAQYTFNEGKGALGNTFDATADSFGISRFSAVELGQVWNMNAKFLIPVLRVLFWKLGLGVRRMREATNNYNLYWLTQFDEAHKILGHPQGQQFIVDRLKLGRRDKFVMGMFSQGIREFVDSPAWGDIDLAVQTRLYYRDPGVLDNSPPQLGQKRQRDYYAAAGLPEHGIARVADVEPYSVVMHQPAWSQVSEFSWRLDKAWLAIVGRTSALQNRWLDDMIARYPKTWREEVLASEGVPREDIAAMLALIAAHKERESQPSPLVGGPT